MTKDVKKEMNNKCTTCGLLFSGIEAMEQNYECCTYITGSDVYVPTIESIKGETK